MDIKLVKSFEENKGNIRNDIREKIVKAQGYIDYLDLVEILFSNIEYVNKYGVDEFKVDKIKVIDNGDYQGTLIFIIPLNSYQPDVTDHFYTHNYYGSCSGCDMMMSISMHYTYENREKSVDDLMGMCLNLIQQTKKMEA